MFSQTELPLYEVVPNNKPNIENKEQSAIDDQGILRISKVTIPILTMFKPEKPNGVAVIICPGGGYGILAASHEGSDVAKAMNEWGITVFVLKYRLPNANTMMNKAIAPLQDAQRAIQMVRENAKQWKIKKSKVGIMGFSAGGHLAASLCTRYKEELITNFNRTSLKPNFSILIYPVISFQDSLTHLGSRINLIGKKPSSFTIDKYSNEAHVSAKTPPAFLVHAKDDDAVTFQNSLGYYEALQKQKVSAYLKLYEKGGHGFGMKNPKTGESWMDELRGWLTKMKVL